VLLLVERPQIMAMSSTLVLLSLLRDVGGTRVESSASAVPLLMQHVKMLSSHPRSAGIALPLMNMLQTLEAHKGSAQWTANVKKSLSDSSNQLDDVQTSITEHNSATQSELDTMVLSMVGAAGSPKGQAELASDAKSLANAKNAAWLSCVAVEKTKMQTILTGQGYVRNNLSAEIAPCKAEYDTQFFNMTEGALSVSCALDETGQEACVSGLGSLTGAGNAAKSDISTWVADKVQLHVDAEGNCHQATNNTADAIVEVRQSQVAWTSQHGTCDTSFFTERNYRICEFGTKLKTVCESKAAYNARVAQIDGVDNPYSVADRVAEMETIVLVQCLMDTFKTTEAMTAADVSSCQGAQSTSNLITSLTIDDKETTVNLSLLQNGVICADGTQWEFKEDAGTTHFFAVPVFSTTDEVYTIGGPSREDAVVYGRQDSWTTAFNSQADSTFAQCEA